MENNIPSLIHSRWADIWENWIISKHWEFPLQMASSDWTAMQLVFFEKSKFWADLIRFAPWKRVWLHTHPWDHILLVTKWSWILTYWKDEFPLSEGMIYLVPWSVPHAIDASSNEELVLMAIWNNLIHAESPDRLKLV